MTRAATDQLYIELDYFTPEEYFVYTAEAVMAAGGDSSLTATVGVIKQGATALASDTAQSSSATRTRTLAAALVSDTALTGTISHIHGADLTAFSDAVLTANIEVLQASAAADLSSDTVLGADVAAIRGVDSAMSSDSAFAVDALRLRPLDSAMSSDTAFAADLARIRTVDSALSADTGFTVAETVTLGTSAALSSDAALTCAATEIPALWRTDTWMTGVNNDTHQKLTDEAVTSDDEGNIYTTTTTTQVGSPTYYYVTITKRTAAGTKLWQISRRVSTQYLIASKNVIHNGELYVAVSPSNLAQAVILRINTTTGALGVSVKTSGLIGIADFAIDTDGSLYAVSLNGAKILKTTVDNVFAWEKDFTYGGINYDGMGIAVASDAVYVGVRVTNSTTSRLLKISKSTGSKLWVRSFDHTINDIALDSSENVVIVGDSGINFSADARVTKITPAGAIVWNKKISDTFTANRMFVDADDIIYMIPAVDATSLEKLWILNADGTALKTISMSIVGSGDFDIADCFVNGDRLLISGGSQLQASVTPQYTPSFTLSVPKTITTSYINIPTRAPMTGYTWSLTTSSASTTDLTTTVTSQPDTIGSSSFLNGGLSLSSTTETFYDYNWLQIVDMAPATFASDTQQTAAPNRIRQFSSSAAADTQQSAQGTRIAIAAANLQVDSTITAAANKTASGAMSNSSDTVLNSDIDRVRFFDSSLSSDTNFLAAVNRTASGVADFAADTSATATALRIKQLAAAFEANTINLAATVKIGDFLVTLQSNTEVAAQVARTARGIAALSSDTAMTATANVIRSADAAFSAETEIVVNGAKFKLIESNMVSQFAASATASRTAAGTVDLQVDTASTVDLLRLRQSAIDLAVDTEATATADRTRGIVSTIDSDFTLVGGADKYVRFEAALVSDNIQLTLATTIRIDPYRTWVVKQETGSFIITEETRTLGVDQETAIYKIKGYQE